MRNKILLGVVIILSLILVVVVSNKNNTNHSFLDEEIHIKVKDKETIETLKLEDYLIGVLAAEIPASFDIEALKAQAVASRTYALYKINHSNNDYNILADIKDQAYITEEEMKDKWKEDYQKYYNKIKEAIEATKNEAMYYNDEIIESYYFSMSNGKTAEASLVFSESLPYIQSVDSSWDNETIRNFIFEKEITKEIFCQKLEINNCNEIKIDNINKDNTNRILTININDKTYKGTEIRNKLELRSTDFSFELNNNNIKITTKGYGHGVGMSQYGANGMAKEGKNYQEILNYYYKNILIKKIV